MTDTHLYPEKTGKLLGVNTLESFQAVISYALEEAKPDLLIATGDLAQVGDTATYKLFLEVVSEIYKGPVICTPGNHDLNIPFKQVLPTEPVSFCGWHFIPIDTHIDNQVGGHISDSELDTLEDMLVDKCHGPSIVFGHHPPVRVGAEWLDQHRIDNGDRLVNLMSMSGDVRGYICGHVHQAYDCNLGGFRVMTTPSTCFQFQSGSKVFTVTGGAPGYRWLDLYPDGSIVSSTNQLPDFELTLDVEKTKN